MLSVALFFWRLLKSAFLDLNLYKPTQKDLIICGPRPGAAIARGTKALLPWIADFMPCNKYGIIKLVFNFSMKYADPEYCYRLHARD